MKHRKPKYIFRSRLQFKKPDPLADGLGDMIREAQRSKYAFDLYEDETELGEFWQAMNEDLHNGRELEFSS